MSGRGVMETANIAGWYSLRPKFRRIFKFNLSEQEEAMSKLLKPCPFCGNEVWLAYSSARKAFCFWHRGSRNCGIYEFVISDQEADSLAEAARIWNRREYDGETD